MPPKKEPAVKKPAAKPVAKAPAKKPAAKPVAKAPAKKPESKPAAKKPFVPEENPRASIILLLTKCKGEIVLLIGKESYEKWGPPGGGIAEKEAPRAAADRIFTEEVGYPMPKIEKEATFRHRNAQVFLLFTADCIEEKLGPKINKKPVQELTALKHVPVKTIYQFLEKPDVDSPLRPVFISMIIEHKKEVDAFIKSVA